MAISLSKLVLTIETVRAVTTVYSKHSTTSHECVNTNEPITAVSVAVPRVHHILYDNGGMVFAKNFYAYCSFCTPPRKAIAIIDAMIQDKKEAALTH